MPSLPIEVPIELVGELTTLGDGDPTRGVRIALLAARTLAETESPDQPAPRQILFQIFRALNDLDAHNARLLKLIERYDLERSAFFTDLERIVTTQEDPS